MTHDTQLAMWGCGRVGPHPRGALMKRREFITLLGGAAAAWPLAARAQQGGRVRRIAVLSAFAEADPEVQASLTAFLQALQKLGWTDGSNVRSTLAGATQI